MRRRPRSWNGAHPFLVLLLLFATEFDALDVATDELKAKLMPVSNQLKDERSGGRWRRKLLRRPRECWSA